METLNIIMVLVAVFSAGLTIGILIKNKEVQSLKDEIDWHESKYNTIVDAYSDCLVRQYRIQTSVPDVSRKAEAPAVAKKKAGRPKGSTNKSKKDGGSTTRKYTRKSSK